MGNFDGSADWIRGRIHLSIITDNYLTDNYLDNYKKKIKLEMDKFETVKKAMETAIAPTVALGIVPRRQKRTMALEIKS